MRTLKTLAPGQRLSASDYNTLVSDVSRMGHITSEPPLEIIPNGTGIHMRVANSSALTATHVRLTSVLSSSVATTINQTGGISSTDTSVTVTSVSSLPTLFPYYLWIDGETVKVTDAVSTLLTITRCVVGVPANHSNGTAVKLVNPSYGWQSVKEVSTGIWVDDTSGTASGNDPSVSGAAVAYCSDPAAYPIGDPFVVGSADTTLTVFVTLYQNGNTDWVFDFPRGANYTHPGMVRDGIQYLGSGAKFVDTLRLGSFGSGTTYGILGYVDDGTDATMIGTAYRSAGENQWSAVWYGSTYPTVVNSTADTLAHIGTPSKHVFAGVGYVRAVQAFVIGPSDVISPPALLGEDATSGTHTLPAGFIGFYIRVLTDWGISRSATQPDVSCVFGTVTLPYPAHGCKLTWTAVDGATGYELYRVTGATLGDVTTGGASPFKIIDDPSVTTYTDYGDATFSDAYGLCPNSTNTSVGDQSATQQIGINVVFSGGSLLIQGGIVVKIEGENIPPVKNLTAGKGININTSSPNSRTNPSVGMKPNNYAGSQWAAAMVGG